jgi:hypothetical protein
MENCTFKPEISQNCENNARGVKDLYEWEMERKAKIEVERLYQTQNIPNYDFKPKISARSIKMAEKSRTSNTPLHERLMKAA